MPFRLSQRAGGGRDLWGTTTSQNGGEDSDDDPCGIPGSGAMGASARSKKQRRLVPLVGVPLFRRAAPDT